VDAIVGILAGCNAKPQLGPLCLEVLLEESHYLQRYKYFVGAVGKILPLQVVLGED
jgi:hypothetical protein